jgi:predicted GIY-YIG superfamily endonuclease
MSLLLTFNEARSKMGITTTALKNAIERGDLIQVDLEGIRGSTRSYVTEKSLQSWINRMNGQDDPGDAAVSEHSRHHTQISQLSFFISQLVEKVDKAVYRMESRQERDRRTRLRHTVSSRIGDSFDPHGYYVYLLWGENEDRPVYIGQSRNVLGRLGTHMQNPEKRCLVKSVQLIRCSGEATMKRTEAALIREYKPSMNIAGTI